MALMQLQRTVTTRLAGSHAGRSTPAVMVARPHLAAAAPRPPAPRRITTARVAEVDLPTIDEEDAAKMFCYQVCVRAHNSARFA
jgi:hypothetical protein